jgi:hypothetical protein
MPTDHTSSVRLARLLGPSLVTITSTELLNSHIWSSNTAPGIYLNGCLLFVAGLAIVQNHNVWIRSWEMVITVLGWGGMMLGVVRMAMPGRVLEAVRNDGRTGGGGIWGMGMLVLGMGVFLMGKGYGVM